MGRYDTFGFEGSMINPIVTDFVIDYNTVKKIIAGTTLKGINYAIHTSKSPIFIQNVIKQREWLVNKLSFSALITLKQSHSNRIYVINNRNKQNFLKGNVRGDGLITDERNILLGVLTADCVPIFYFDSKGSFVGIVHAGWRGAKKKIHQKVLRLIFKNYKVKARDIIIIIGPHIRECCYKVGQDMYNKVGQEYIQKRNGRLYVNLENIIIRDLIKEGISDNNINRCLLCTYCSENPSFYSYRRANLEERMLSFIGIKD